MASKTYADSTVEVLAKALASTSFVDNVPDLIVSVIEHDYWRERVIERTHEVACFTRFEDFVRTPPLEGLGSTLDIIDRLCKGHRKAEDALDRVMQRPHGQRGAERPEEEKDVYNVNIFSEERPVGNTTAYALRRLRAQRPDLHEQVLADMLSPHAAMVQAGFRKRTVSIPIDDPADVARRLRALLTPEQRRNVAALLATEEG